MCSPYPVDEAILAPTREAIFSLCRGQVRIGVPDHSTLQVLGEALESWKQVATSYLLASDGMCIALGRIQEEISNTASGDVLFLRDDGGEMYS